MAVIHLDAGVDRTVRAPIREEECWVDHPRGGPQYVGPDHSTYDGACRLAKRLRLYWAARGTERQFEVYEAVHKHGATGIGVWGVRPATPDVFAPAMQEAA